MPSKSARGNAANYLARAVSPLGVPQSEALTPKQVKNNAGGFVFEADPMARVRRFLILGSEGGSYYAREATLTRENAAHLIAQIERDGKAVVQEIVAISDAGRAPKNDPAIFALALCAASDNLETRQAAFAALPKVCRIGTHLFHFTQYVLPFVSGGAACALPSRTGTCAGRRRRWRIRWSSTRSVTDGAMPIW